MSTVTEEQLPAAAEQQKSATELVALQVRQDRWKIAQAMSHSALVPAHFRNKPEDCFIMADLAERLDVPLLLTLQATYIVHGKPGFEGKFVAALLDRSGKITGPIDYEFSGEGDSYGCQAVVHDRALNKVIHGPKVDWKMVKAERWNEDGKDRSGNVIKSKWNTLPELMFPYRAVAFLVRTRYPSVLMGMNTRDELEDISDVPATLTPSPAASKAAMLASEMTQDDGGTDSDPAATEPDADSDQAATVSQKQAEYKEAIAAVKSAAHAEQVGLALDHETVLSARQIAGFRRSLTAKSKELGLTGQPVTQGAES